jgi:ABC-2 type transport system permease protein
VTNGLATAPYTALLSARYRMLLQYRAAAMAGAVTQLFWGFIKIMILMAFFRSSSAPQPMAVGDVVTYVWLGQGLLGLLPWNHDVELEKQIRDGDVAYELLRPLDLYAYWAMRTLARRVAATSLRILPIVAVAGFALPALGFDAWRLAPPDSAEAAALFALAMVLAVALGCAITMLVHVSLLWTISGDGIARLMPALVTVFSGMVVPLPLFPDWAQPFLELLPFRALVDVPYRIYTGDILSAEAALPLVLGLVWLVGLVFLGRRLLARGQRALVVQGG